MSKTEPANRLYYGDNLDILRRYIDDESVDLIYLDPPFNSNADYNVLFAEKSGEKAHSQIKAFEDTWTWDEEAAREYHEVLTSGHTRVAKALKGMHDFLGGNDMLAYLSMMALRLIELRRVLKPTGSIYLHCDPTASHYLKIVMDAVFGPENFRNEITWKRRVGMSSAVHDSNRFGTITDIILFYARSSETLFHPQYNRESADYQQYIEERFTMKDKDGRLFQATSLVNPAPRPNLRYEYKGFLPPPNGWMISKEKMEQWDREGRIYFPKDNTKRLRRKSYADELKGMPIQNLWLDIPEINSRAQERLGYPTQKPSALLERIIAASTNEGDVVLDPFCGCGTSIAAAQKLSRRWIGIDITHLAINLIKVRLADAFGPKIVDQYKVIGEPTDLAGAQALADQDKYQFQYWALGFVNARPAQSDEKKGADKGIDGRLYMTDGTGDTKSIIISVKGGHVGAAQVRDLRGVIEREDAAIGVFICIETPTSAMRKEAADAGFFSPKGLINTYGNTKFPRLQILTIEELLSGKRIDMPPSQDIRSFKQAPKAKSKKKEDAGLF